eukprot:g10975.t1
MVNVKSYKMCGYPSRTVARMPAAGALDASVAVTNVTKISAFASRRQRRSDATGRRHLFGRIRRLLYVCCWQQAPPGEARRPYFASEGGSLL